MKTQFISPVSDAKSQHYYHAVNTALLSMIDGKPRKILEIGCASGKLGEAVKSRFACHYVGIEINADLHAEAASKIDCVIIDDIQRMDLAEHGLEPGSFDYIVYGDVLEHLYDPWTILNYSTQFLSDSGYIVASIPNIRNLEIIHDLIKGRFTYKKEGILDATHVRFFTLHEIKAMFTHCGLDIVEIKNTLQNFFDINGASYPGNLDLPGLTIKNISYEDALELCTVQFIIKAGKNYALRTSIPNQAITPIIETPQALPLVSVCIPTFNGAQYLDETLNSVLAQTYGNLEIVLSDDASSDATLDIARAFQDKFKCEFKCEFKILQHDPAGMVDNWNFCLAHAQGEYIKFLHQDDVLAPACIEKLVALARQDAEIGLVFSKRELIVSARLDGNSLLEVKNLHEAWPRLGPVQSGQDLLRSANILANPINKIGEPSTVLIRKSAFDALGVFDTTLCQLVDVEMWFRVMSGYKIGFVDEVLSYWRVHDTQQTKRNTKDREIIRSDWSRFLQKISQADAYPDSMRRQAAALCANWAPAAHGSAQQTPPLSRLALANEWLRISATDLEAAYTGELGNHQRAFLAQNVRETLLTEAEKEFVARLKEVIAQGRRHPQILQHLLAASLYCYPHELPESWFNTIDMPIFMLDYLVNFMLDSPGFFKEIGEADAYYRYVSQWVAMLHTHIRGNPSNPTWQRISMIFAQRANFIPLYFNTQNLREIYVRRAEIIAFALALKGFKLDYAFPPRAPSRAKIRVGFLNSHFTPQTETYSTLPAFEYLGDAFEVTLYAIRVNGHPLEQYCASRAQRLVKLPEDIKARVEMIRQDDLDFLIIGTNTTAVVNEMTILASHRLARIQLTSFNSPVTTGMKNIDYYITGKLSEFPHSPHYQEKLLLLDKQGYCFSYGSDMPEPAMHFDRARFQIPPEAVVFISAANFYKLTPELKDLWVRILAATPQSMLVLMPFGKTWNGQYPEQALLESLSEVCAQYGVSSERIKVVESLPNRVEVLEALKIADVYLDSYPYSGTTSLLEPLHAGLPIVVWEGNTLRNRMGAAMLRSIGLDKLVVHNEQSYIKLAVTLANTPALRQTYRDKISREMTGNPPFMDSRAYSAQIARLLHDLVKKHPHIFPPQPDKRGEQAQTGKRTKKKRH